jgi:hypothetical protein
VIDALNSDDVMSAEREFANKNIQALGGLSAVYQNLPYGWEDTKVAELKEKLASPQYTSGVNANGEKWTLSEEEVAWIAARGEKLIRKVAEMTRVNDLTALNGIYALPVNEYQDDIASSLADWTNEYVLTVLPGQETVLTVKNKDGKDVNVKLAKFAYSQKLRKSASTLLSPSRFQGDDVVGAQKKATKERFSKLVEQSVGPRDQYDESKLPTEMKKWLAEQSEIESAL